MEEHSHVLGRIAVGSVFQPLPAAQMCSGAVQQVTVTGWQKLTHQHHKRIDPHHDQVLTRPAHVVVLRALENMEQSVKPHAPI